MRVETIDKRVTGGHVREHWHDGVMVEANFVPEWSAHKFFEAAVQADIDRGKPWKCWFACKRAGHESWAKRRK